ncbi:MAG: hypothetical protein U0768_21965 [Anaerolineae bacterium]
MFALALLTLTLGACQALKGTPPPVAVEPQPTAPAVRSATPAAEATRASPPSVTPGKIVPPTPRLPLDRAAVSMTPVPSPAPLSTPAPTPAVPFGLEQADLLAPLIGKANAFGYTRIPADPTTFDANNAVRGDASAFRGWREYVVGALEAGRVAFVLETDAADTPETVAARARSLATLHPTARPWLIIIGNELNLQRQADYPVETYYRQLRAAYDAVKAVDPNIMVSTDGQNYWEGAPYEHPMADPNATDRIRALLGVFQRESWTPDLITIHIFDSVWSPGDGREVYSLVGRTRFYQDILSGYSLPRPLGIFVGEYGLPVTEPVPAAQQGKWWRFFITEREQADLAFMAAVWSAATGTRLNYFGGQDTPPEGLRRNERGEIVEGVYGVVASDGRKRPAFSALRRAQTLLPGASGRVVADGQSGVGAACFALADGRQMCAAQATVGADRSLAVGPFPAGAAFHVEDALGNTIPNAAAQQSDGRIVLSLPGAAAQKVGGAVRVLFVDKS